MSARLAKVSPWLLIAISLGLTPTAGSAGAWLLKPGEFQSDLTGSSFSTSTYYDDNGDNLTFASNGVVQRHAIESASVLGWKKWANLRFRVPFENRTVQAGPYPDAQNSLTQTGLGDLLIGLVVKIKDGPTALSIEGDWRAPLGYNERLVPPLGNGLQYFGGSLNFGTAIPAIQGFFEASGGMAVPYPSDLVVRDLEPAPADTAQALTVVSASLGFWAGTSLLVAGNYDGVFESDNKDQVVEYPLTRNRGGIELIYRVDDHLDVIAGGRHTFSGQNALQTDEFYVGVAAKKSHLDRLQGFLGSKRRH